MNPHVRLLVGRSACQTSLKGWEVSLPTLPSEHLLDVDHPHIEHHLGPSDLDYDLLELHWVFKKNQIFSQFTAAFEVSPSSPLKKQ